MLGTCYIAKQDAACRSGLDAGCPSPLVGPYPQAWDMAAPAGNKAGINPGQCAGGAAGWRRSGAATPLYIPGRGGGGGGGLACRWTVQPPASSSSPLLSSSAFGRLMKRCHICGILEMDESLCCAHVIRTFTHTYYTRILLPAVCVEESVQLQDFDRNILPFTSLQLSLIPTVQLLVCASVQAATYSREQSLQPAALCLSSTHHFSCSTIKDMIHVDTDSDLPH